MTSHAKIVQLDQPKVEHVTSLTHLGLDSNLLSKTLLIYVGGIG